MCDVKSQEKWQFSPQYPIVAQIRIRQLQKFTNNNLGESQSEKAIPMPTLLFRFIKTYDTLLQLLHFHHNFCIFYHIFLSSLAMIYHPQYAWI